MFGFLKGSKKEDAGAAQLEPVASQLEKKTPAGIWLEVMSTLAPGASYTKRLEALFAMLDAVLNLDVYYLYLIDPGGERFTLEHMKIKELPLTPEMESEVPSEVGGESTYQESTYEDVQSIMRSPPLNFPRAPDYEQDHLRITEVGHLYTVPLRRNSDLVGLIQVGPVEAEAKNVLNDIQKRLEKFIIPLSFAITQARAEEDLRGKMRDLEDRSEVSRKLLSSAFELDEFISLLLDLALKATGSEGGFVAMSEGAPPRWTIRASQNIPDRFVAKVNLVPGEGLFEWVSSESRALMIRDWDFVQEMGLKSILAVPLVEGEDILGMFALVNFEKKGEILTEYSLKLLEVFMEQIKLVLENVRLMDVFTERYLTTLQGLAKSVDVRYPGTISHTERVTRIAVEIGRRMGLSPQRINILETAARVHDVGMCGVAEISRGFQADFNHPTIGADMVSILPLPQSVVEAIATHHEWYDGWGFPKGLKGDEISLEGRILALAEYFVEATTVTDIRPSMSLTKLRQEVEVRRGSQFDPAVVDALLELLRQKREKAGGGALEECYVFKSCPDDLKLQCPSQHNPTACWEQRPDVQCAGHGDEKCENCFLYIEWQERRAAE